MSDFPTVDQERSHWSVWRGNTWLGEWTKGKPRKGEKIKPNTCLMSKTVVSCDDKTGRIYVK